MAPYAIIFDCDGTLIDSNEEHIDAWVEAFGNHGYDVPAERIRSEVGKGSDQLVPAILGPATDRQRAQRLGAAHDDIFRRIAREQHLQLFDGAMHLLKTLQRRWLTTALATSSKRAMLEEMQKSVQEPMLSRFDLVVSADSVARSKPAPDLILATLWKLALPANRCVFVGDTIHDAEAAAHAGVPFIGLLCGRCATETQLMLAGAISVWRDPADLLDNLDQALALGELVAY